MSLWTCIACKVRRAVGLEACPQCGTSDYQDGDTVSGAEGGQGQAYVPPAYADAAPVTPAPTPVVPAQRTDPAPAPSTPPEPPASPQ